MRKIGSLPSAPQAERFRDYLASRGIANRIDPDGGQWDVWIYSEEQVPTSREELDQFLAAPDSARYNAPRAAPAPVTPPPPAMPRRRRIRPEGSDRTPVTIMITALTLAITLGSDFGHAISLTNRMLIAPPGDSLQVILQGEFWRLYTPMFLHFNMLHLAFDVYMFWMLGSVIERVRGSAELVWLILLIAPASHLTQYAISGPGFGGLSGVVYGLFGYLWMRSVLLPDDGFFMPQGIVIQMVVWAFLGLTGALGLIGNGAHFGGLFAGMVLGAVPRLWRDR